MGASLKNGLVGTGERPVVQSASTWLGKVPLASNALICCSGAVSHAASFLGLLDVVTLRGDGEVGATPVATAAGEDVGDVPALDALGVALDHTEHPARAGHGGEAVVLEGRGPVVAPLGARWTASRRCR